jgi:hypothetical protein
MKWYLNGTSVLLSKVIAGIDSLFEYFMFIFFFFSLVRVVERVAFWRVERIREMLWLLMLAWLSDQKPLINTWPVFKARSRSCNACELLTSPHLSSHLFRLLKEKDVFRAGWFVCVCCDSVFFFACQRTSTQLFSLYPRRFWLMDCATLKSPREDDFFLHLI